MKLAACLYLMEGRDPEYVLTQYRALCSLDFDSMSTASKAFCRQIESGKSVGRNAHEALARGLKVFDVKRKDANRSIASDDDIINAVELVRTFFKQDVVEAA
jgi:hypothetical protein